MPTPEEPTNISNFSQFQSKRGKRPEATPQSPEIVFTNSVVRLEGDIYDETQVYFGGEPLTDFISRMRADIELSEDLQTTAIVAAEGFVMNARAAYINQRLKDTGQKAKAYQDLAEHTWDRAAIYESEHLRERVVSLVTTVFTTHEAGGLLERLHLRTTLTERQEENELQLDESPVQEAPRNVILFKRRDESHQTE
ncbi:MAG TPA: hypothetical protein VLG12_03055 [Candidatus Saccharimonadales bacterium]|nr:hypothetical protein [Candidatus Saccharimonadales bacterium]